MRIEVIENESYKTVSILDYQDFLNLHPELIYTNTLRIFNLIYI